MSREVSKWVLVGVTLAASGCIREGHFQWSDSGFTPDGVADTGDSALDRADDAPSGDKADVADPGVPDEPDVSCPCHVKGPCCDGCVALADGQPCPDDGIACTTDTCHDGTCVHSPPQGGCVIGQSCVSDGTFDPESGLCRRCEASGTPGQWKNLPDGT